MKITMFKYKHHLYWLIPALFYLISSQFSVINVDGIRDFLAAYQIIEKGEFTLIGPQMAFSFHMGPIWYYLMALPLLLSKTWGLMSLFVSFLTSLKFYIAYKLGEKILGIEFAILLVFSLLLASFTLIQQIIFTHTNLIELAVLSVIYYCHISDSNKYSSWFVIGLLLGLSVHIHPTTGVVSFWAILKLIHSKHWFKNGLLMMTAIITVFTPLIIHEFLSDFENIKGALTYFSYNTNSNDYFGYFNLVYGLIFITPLVTYKMLFPLFVANLLFIIHCVFIISTVILAVVAVVKQNRDNKTLFLKILAFFLYSSIFIFLIRKSTPWYMTYSLSLSLSLLIAYSLWLIYKWLDLKKMPSIIYSTGLIVFVSMMSMMMYKLNNNLLLPPAIAWNDIRSLSTMPLENPGFEFPAHLANSHAQYLCQNSPVSLHGPYAALIHSHSGIEYLTECKNKHIYYGADTEKNTLLGVPGSFQSFIKKQPVHTIGDSYFYHPLSVSDKQKDYQEDFLSEYKRTYLRIKDWQKTSINTTLDHGQYLTITKILGGMSEIKINNVMANNKELKPIAQTNYSTLFFCDNCNSTEVIWSVSYSESVAGMTDIVSF